MYPFSLSSVSCRKPHSVEAKSFDMLPCPLVSGPVEMHFDSILTGFANRASLRLESHWLEPANASPYMGLEIADISWFRIRASLAS